MRIRKRQVHLSSSSSFSPLHLSDPHLVNRSPGVVQLDDAATTHTTTSVITAPSSLDRYQPSDQTLQLIGKLPSNGCDDVSGIGESGVHKQLNKQQPLDSGDSEEKGNNTSKEDILVSQVLPSSTSFTQDGKWWEGEKAIPLKKRRGGLEKEMEDNKKMKAKMNKKCSMQKGEDEDEKVEEEMNVNVTKKKSRGSAVLMEGSRCSRVNGRGWRCCQQTLVGYSLCEHHLGKGRLRSMTSVRNRSLKKEQNNNTLELSISDSSSSLEKKTTSGIDDNVDDDDDEKKKAVIITKKRMKLGMVKARSMSSLLGQTNTQVSVPDQEEIINK